MGDALSVPFIVSCSKYNHNNVICHQSNSIAIFLHNSYTTSGHIQNYFFKRPAPVKGTILSYWGCLLTRAPSVFRPLFTTSILLICATTPLHVPLYLLLLQLMKSTKWTYIWNVRSNFFRTSAHKWFKCLQNEKRPKKNVATIQNNVAKMWKRCIQLKIVFVNHLLYHLNTETCQRVRKNNWHHSWFKGSRLTCTVYWAIFVWPWKINGFRKCLLLVLSTNGCKDQNMASLFSHQRKSQYGESIIRLANRVPVWHQRKVHATIDF